MTKNISKLNKCNDCNGTGYILTSQRSYVNCIICNGSGSTSHGSSSEAEQVLLFKVAWDYINGKQNGWYH